MYGLILTHKLNIKMAQITYNKTWGLQKLNILKFYSPCKINNTGENVRNVLEGYKNTEKLLDQNNLITNGLLNIDSPCANHCKPLQQI